MACRLVGAKPLSEPMLVDWKLRNKFQWNFKHNSYIFIQENAFENVVCEMAAIFSRPQCVSINGMHMPEWCSPTVTCRNDTSQSKYILTAALQWLRRNMDHNLNSLTTVHNPSRVIYRLNIASIPGVVARLHDQFEIHGSSWWRSVNARHRYSD